MYINVQILNKIILLSRISIGGNKTLGKRERERERKRERETDRKRQTGRGYNQPMYAKNISRYFFDNKISVSHYVIHLGKGLVPHRSVIQKGL